MTNKKALRTAESLQQFSCLCGIDEAGRGPLAGPVVAAAVVFKSSAPEGLADSKKLSATKRQALLKQIQSCAYIGVGVVGPERIDEINILQATFEAMRLAFGQLSCALDAIIIDGDKDPGFNTQLPSFALIKGDALVKEVSAASIVAKETRDSIMAKLDLKYPGYGFSKHSGYGTPSHLAAIRALGPSPVHRRSFEPIKSLVLSF